MGKKRTRTKKISKATRPSVSSFAVNAIRASRDAGEIFGAKLQAWREGKNPWLTVANTNKQETNRLFYRIKANAYFGGSFKELKNRGKRENTEAAA